MQKTLNFQKYSTWFLFGIMILNSLSLFPSNALAHCPNGQREVIKNEISIDSKYKPRQNTKQGINFGTCYGFAVTYLLEYLYNLTKNLNLANDKRILGLSQLSVLGNACDRNLIKANLGGFPWAVLYKLQHRPNDEKNEISTSQSMPYHLIEKLHQNDQWISPDCRNSGMAALKCMNIPLEQKSFDLAKHLQEVSINPETYHFDLIDKVPHTKLEMPPYNIHIISALTTGTSQTIVREHFNKKPLFPPILDTTGHSVVVTGVRSHCCGKDCYEEWNIVDSLEGKRNGWTKSEAFSGLKRFVSISPCGTNPWEPCLKEILGPSAFAYIAHVGDVKDLEDYLKKTSKQIDKKIVCTAFFFSMIESKRETLEFLIKEFPDWPKWMTSGVCNTQIMPIAIAGISDMKILDFLYKTLPSIFTYINSEGQTLAHKATIEGNMMVLEFLASKYPSLFMKVDRDDQTPAHIAGYSGNCKVFSMIAQKFPDSLKEKDSWNLTPLQESNMSGETIVHKAAMLEDLDLIKLIHKIDPDALKQTDRRGNTPMDLAKKHGKKAAYDLLHNLLNQSP